MLNRLRIGPRLILLIAVQAVILVVIGAAALIALRGAADSTRDLNASVSASARIGYFQDIVRGELYGTVNRVNTGALIWSEGRERLTRARTNFENLLKDYREQGSADDQVFLQEELTPALADARATFDELERFFQAEDRVDLSLFVLNDMDVLLEPFLTAVVTRLTAEQKASEQTFNAALQRINGQTYGNVAVVLIGLLAAAVLGVMVFRSITEPVQRIEATVREVNAGNLEVRTELAGEDEISELGQALDQLLEEKVTALAQAEADNEKLNESVLHLLEGVSQLSQRDLTVQLPIAEDVTGPVADAINLMAEETDKVLQDVTRVAKRVGVASTTVYKKAAMVNETADAQQKEIEDTALQLAKAADTLNRIAMLARESNASAERTTQSTERAVGAVNGTLSGMGQIRDAIQETGKRIKRLGERSQEISGVVDIINTIAERTHVLALNASMQSAAAGEAGKGFSVVANEVQRLAEGSRDATAQIAQLVKNIQVETSDTIATMDRTIQQVVDGSNMAEDAGKQMRESQQATFQLVDSVRQIAQGSQQQAQISNQLRDRANVLVQRTRASAKEVDEQLSETRNLMLYARRLINSVSMFKLSA